MTKKLAPDRILQLGIGFMCSKTLLSAIEFGLFTELADTTEYKPERNVLNAIVGRLERKPR